MRRRRHFRSSSRPTPRLRREFRLPVRFSHAPRVERLSPDITGRNSLTAARSCSLHNVISYPQPSQVVPFTQIERPRLENLGGVSPTRAEPRIGEKTMSELLKE